MGGGSSKAEGRAMVNQSKRKVHTTVVLESCIEMPMHLEKEGPKRKSVCLHSIYGIYVCMFSTDN